VPRYRSSRRPGYTSSATGTVWRTTRRARKSNGIVRPSLPELGLYRTVAELADVTPFPEYVIRKWIRQGYIKLVWYKGAWYLSKKQFYSWYRICLEIFPIFMESLTEDFGFPVIFEDGKYRRL
jgi:hypothetical protein